MNFKEFQAKSAVTNATLVAVSKTHPTEKIMEIYDQGQREFGENKVQEMLMKENVLPDDIHWHMIGHLQTNKVKYIARFVHLIHSLDRISLAREINKQGKQVDRVIPALLQVKIASEESKFGLEPDQIDEFMDDYLGRNFTNVRISGVMGMATFTDDEDIIRHEFSHLEQLFSEVKAKYFKDDPGFVTKSYGMSADYEIALETGSNMIRVGSLIFGDRN